MTSALFADIRERLSEEYKGELYTAIEDIARLLSAIDVAIEALKRCTESDEWDGKDISTIALGTNLILNMALKKIEGLSECTLTK